MIYLYAEDGYYYKESSLLHLQNQHELELIVAFPEKSDIKKYYSNENIGFIAPYLPGQIDERYQNSGFFSVFELPNTKGILTSKQAALGIDPNDVLEEKYGIAIYEPSYTFEDMGVSEELMAFVDRMSAMEALNIKTTGIFLVGIPGSGKTFFAKCFSGHTGRSLVELNLTKIIYQPNPIFALESVFRFLSRIDAKFTIWIDEIEKQFGSDERSKQVLGKMLTILNDLNGPTSKFAIDAIFLATANNIISIMEKNPEFMRKGRFDELFFMNYPSIDNAKKIYEIYRKKTNKMVENEIFYSLLLKSVNTRFGIIEDKDSVSKKEHNHIKEISNVTKIRQILIPLHAYAEDIYASLDQLITDALLPSSKIKEGRLLTAKEQGIDEKPEPHHAFEMGPEKQHFIMNVFKKEYLKKYGEDALHQQSLQKFCERLHCTFESTEVIQYPEIVWRNDKIQRHLYVYTPAEIEYFVKEYFSMLIVHGKVTEEHYIQIADRMQPIQKSMNDGINILLGQKELFVEV